MYITIRTTAHHLALYIPFVPTGLAGLIQEVRGSVEGQDAEIKSARNVVSLKELLTGIGNLFGAFKEVPREAAGLKWFLNV